MSVKITFTKRYVPAEKLEMVNETGSLKSRWIIHIE